MTSRSDVIDELQVKFKTLDETLWENRAKWPHIEKWAAQFKSAPDATDDEQVQMLFLASHFMYFGLREIRALLRSLFRDLYQYNVVARIRNLRNHTRDRHLIASELQQPFTHTISWHRKSFRKR
jgi:hypothetical protein